MPFNVAIAKLQGDQSDWEALEAEFIPRHNDIPLFHFIPCAHFLTLLREQRLYLTRMNRFRDDELDGVPPMANLTLKSQMAANLARDLPAIEDPIANRRDHEILRGRSYAHCWHAGRNDEKEMWSKFAEGGRGVCIFSSTYRLIRALERQCPSHLEFKIGCCYYRNEDHPTPDLWLTNSLFRMICPQSLSQFL